MKRLWSALALALLMLGTLVPCDALCTSAHPRLAHACCRHTSHIPEIKTCCAPRPVQQSAISQIGTIPSVAGHSRDAAPARVTEPIAELAYAHLMPSAVDAAPAPPLVLRV